MNQAVLKVRQDADAAGFWTSRDLLRASPAAPQGPAGFFFAHMLTTSQAGSYSVAQAIDAVRAVPASVIPYAAATALTRSVQAGKAAMQQRMPQVFERPTAYTLNALRIEPASKDKLTARIAVKDQAGGASTRPESYLLPQEQGGNRGEKRFERALRYMGVLRQGQFAMPGAAAKLDAAGNVSAAEIRTILRALQAVRGGVGAKGQRAGRGKRLQNDLFVGTPTVGSGAGRRNRAGAASGIYRREGHRIRPVFIFGKAPTYARQLDFDGTVSAVVRERFRVEFERAAADILRRNKR